MMRTDATPLPYPDRLSLAYNEASRLARNNGNKLSAAVLVNIAQAWTTDHRNPDGTWATADDWRALETDVLGLLTRRDYTPRGP